MKAIKIVLLFTVVLLSKSTFGQDTMYIHQNVGGVLKVAVNNIDSVIFYDASASTTTNDSTVTDVEGNSYQTVTIGGQVWMKENLNTKKYNDGSAIPLVKDNIVWQDLTTGGYCYYNNDSSAYENIYGALYNWYAVNTGKLCPTGWHVPTEAEWLAQIVYLRSDGVATFAEGIALKSTSGWGNNGNGTNDYGFAALPGGSRWRYGNGGNSQFKLLSTNGYWWSSTGTGDTAKGRTMSSDNDGAGLLSASMNHGTSIRCLKD
jgi:uncharacterized protein (TIGR02145 family)